MEQRFAERKREILAECTVVPAMFVGINERLREFVRPFADCLATPGQQDYAQDYVAGLLSNEEYKNVESIAYFHGQDRRGLQRFVGETPWDHKPLLNLLAEQVGRELGEADGVLVIDPSGFPKKGRASVGVQRQWIGRVGKIDNGQVGVYLGLVSRRGHALVDVRLFLSQEWAKNKKRCRQCGVPEEEICHRTRHELALAMLDEHGAVLPHQWIAGDDEMGRPAHFRRSLRERNERYLLMVPSNTRIRDLDETPAVYSGRGRKPQAKWRCVDRWAAALPEERWTNLDVRDGEKGPLTVQAVKARVATKGEENQADAEEILVVFRARQDDGSWKHDYSFSNASHDTPLAEFARVFKAEHRIEECLQQAKGEAGLADYEVRNWLGWHHHQTLSILATWFLVQETRREKKRDAGNDGSPSAQGVSRNVARRLARGSRPRPGSPHLSVSFATHATGAVLSS